MNFLVAYKFYMKFQTYMNYFRANFLYVVTYHYYIIDFPEHQPILFPSDP